MLTRDDLILERLKALVYCITTQPRLFRWHEGRIEWSPDVRQRVWQPVPMPEISSNETVTAKNADDDYSDETPCARCGERRPHTMSADYCHPPTPEDE